VIGIYHFPGLIWTVTALVTGGVASLGALIQAAFMFSRAPREARIAHVWAGLAGPLTAVVLALLAILLGEEGSTDTDELLDGYWFALPVAGLALWVLVTPVLVPRLES